MREITKQILSRRGLTTLEEQEEFLSPRPKKHYDPLLLRGMREGVDMVLSAVRDGRKITVYGDYDADGVTSTVILMTVFGLLGAEADYYIPSRFDEGYGLNMEAMDKIKAGGTGLIVTVDCGATAVEEVAYAKSLGMDVLVTDHHNCGDELPDTVVIDPKQPDCPYPFKGLAGCGVAYKLALALRDAAGLPADAVNDLMDMVAIGTIADIVPLVDENRTMVKYGLNKVNQRKRTGLRVLLEKSSLGERIIGSQEIAFGIGPRINAAGRMAAATLGVRLFLSDDEGTAAALADQMVTCNLARKATQEGILKQCLDLKGEYVDGYLFPIILAPGAHEGITGIVAGKLREQFDRPIAILVPGADGRCKGTARSIDRVDLYSVLSTQDHLFERFGGHKGACGFTIREADVPELRAGVESVMKQLLARDPHLFEPISLYDMEIEARECDLGLAEELTLLAPFGSMNEEPVFLFKEMQIRDLRWMGAESQHARVQLASRDGVFLTGVMFQVPGDVRQRLEPGADIDFTAALSVNEWQGRCTLQLLIRRII